MEDVLLNLNSWKAPSSFACGHAGETGAVSDLWVEFDAPSCCAAPLPPFSESRVMNIRENDASEVTAENPGFSKEESEHSCKTDRKATTLGKRKQKTTPNPQCLASETAQQKTAFFLFTFPKSRALIKDSLSASCSL